MPKLMVRDFLKGDSERLRNLVGITLQEEFDEYLNMRPRPTDDGSGSDGWVIRPQ